MDAASPAAAHETATEAPVPLRTFTVMSGVPARRTGRMVAEVWRVGMEESVVGRD